MNNLLLEYKYANSNIKSLDNIHKAIDYCWDNGFLYTLTTVIPHGFEIEICIGYPDLNFKNNNDKEIHTKFHIERIEKLLSFLSTLTPEKDE